MNPSSNGWYNGVLNERQGLFPMEFVRPLNAAEAASLKKVNFYFKWWFFIICKLT